MLLNKLISTNIKNVHSVLCNRRLLPDTNLRKCLLSTMAEPVVQINEGLVRGKLSQDERGRDFYSFQGIPYARPPVGSLRFKSPQPVEKWSGMLDATKEGKGCYGRNFLGNGFVGAEDCLFLNVYTSNFSENSSQSLKPVMFWIHGGGFTSGSSSSDFYGPEYLMPENVVLVTINYRLGALGFLKLNDKSLEVPGNAGLKDMVLALKWVQNNIKSFGGDPNNVTIFGESAGGAAVHYLMLSPMANGLFHKAIAQSGCALNPWARGRPNSGQILAEAIGINTKDESIILKSLQDMPVRDLYNNGVKKIRDTFNAGDWRKFCPVIEEKTGDNFLTEDPIDIIKSGNYNKVPLMIGCTSREGMISYGSLPKKYLLSDVTLVPWNFNVKEESPVYKHMANQIKQFYLKGKEPSDNNIDDIFRLYTHNYFALEVYNTAIYHLETLNKPIYFYQFCLDTNMNFIKKMFGFEQQGACHGDDMSYLFKAIASPEIVTGSLEDIGVRKMTKLWANFARFGDPTPEKTKLIPTTWVPLSKERFRYLNIDSSLQMKDDYEREAMSFWNELRKVKQLPNKL